MICGTTVPQWGLEMINGHGCKSLLLSAQFVMGFIYFSVGDGDKSGKALFHVSFLMQRDNFGYKLLQ